MAPQTGLEPVTPRLTAACSANWAIEAYLVFISSARFSNLCPVRNIVALLRFRSFRSVFLPLLGLLPRPPDAQSCEAVNSRVLCQLSYWGIFNFLSPLLGSRTCDRSETLSHNFAFRSFCSVFLPLLGLLPRPPDVQSCEAVNSRSIPELSINKKCRRRLIFPGGCPPSIFSAEELNYRVRDGNGWTLFAIDTDSIWNTVFSVFLPFWWPVADSNRCCRRERPES